jgi:transposase
MKFVGVDLHKKTIFVCVMALVDGERKIERQRRMPCHKPKEIRAFFQQLGQFQVVVEATSSYEWFVLLVEDLADKCVLAHPKRMRVIAESKNKTDKVDAKVLAEFLALNMIPEAYRPSPRIQQFRVLVRHRKWLQGRMSCIKCKLRNKAAFYNSDIAALFTEAGKTHLAQIAMSHADRFECEALQEQLLFLDKQLAKVDKELRAFAKEAPVAEKEARAILQTMPAIGPVTADIVLSELGDPRRFRSAKRVAAYAGLDPGFRKSDGKSKELHITKEGSRILRWAMIQTAWRLTRSSSRWKQLLLSLEKGTGSKKKAIVAVARRVLCVMFAMMRDGKAYQMVT